MDLPALCDGRRLVVIVLLLFGTHRLDSHVSQSAIIRLKGHRLLLVEGEALNHQASQYRPPLEYL